MICFQCGHQALASAQSCSNCGQVFGETRKISRTVTSFKALELRKSRLDSMKDENLLSADDTVDGRYDIQTVIGRGPIGQVYKVRDRETARFAALKAIYPKFYDSASARTELLETLDESSRHAATRVLRPQVVAHGDLILSQSMLVTGVSLAKVIRQRRAKGDALNLLESYPRLTQLHEAIAELYADKPHGLLKPENVLLLADGVRVTDYGLARGLPRKLLVEAQRESGSAAYLAPEVRAGESITVAADVYGLGAIFAEMVSNLPWTDQLPNDERFAARIQAITNADRLLEFVERATATEPSERFQTVPAFGVALSEIAKEVIDVPPEQERRIVAPPSTAMLTLKDMPATVIAPDPDETEEYEQIDSFDSFEDSNSERISVVEYIVSGSGEIISDEDAFLDRVPTKVEARHGATQSAARHRTPTGVIQTRDESGLGSNKLFYPLLAAVVLFGVGGIWGLLHYFETIDGKPSISVSGPSEVGETQTGSANGDPYAVTSLKTSTAEQVDAAQPKSAEKDAEKAQKTEAESASKSSKSTSIASKAVSNQTPDQEQPARSAKLTAATDTAPAAVSKPKPKVVPQLQTAPKAKIKTDKKTQLKPTIQQSKPKPKAKPEETPKSKAKAEVKAAASIPKPKPKEKSVKAKKDAPVASCPGGMRLIRLKRFPPGSVRRGKITGEKAIKIAQEGGAFCVDAYEFPGRGKVPRTSVTRTTAAALCERAGGKRLCTGKEWRRACIGRGGSNYPYGGQVFNPKKCVTEDAEGEERTVRASGDFRTCRSSSGAYDMVGNVGEWTADGRVRGGDVAASDEDASCGASERRSPSFSGRQVGFRCCAGFE